MKIGSGPEPALGPRWAAGELGLDEKADPAAARAEFLRRLPEVEWVPPPAWPLALAILEGWAQPSATTPAREESLRTRERQLREEVDAFTARFFQVPVEKRRRHWRVLSAQCQEHPTLTAWLVYLQKGLDVDLEELPAEPARIAVLVRTLCELFVLRPAERATRRRAFLAGLSRPMKAWQDAVRAVEHEYSTLADLDPVLVQRLATWQETRTHTRKQSKVWGDRFQPSRAAVGSPTVDNLFTAGNGLRYGWIILIVIVAGIRFATLGTSRSDSQGYRPPTMPAWQPNQPFVMPNIPNIPTNPPGSRPGDWQRYSKDGLPGQYKPPGVRPGKVNEPSGVPRGGTGTPLPGRPPVVPKMTPAAPNIPDLPSPRRP